MLSNNVNIVFFCLFVCLLCLAFHDINPKKYTWKYNYINIEEHYSSMIYEYENQTMDYTVYLIPLLKHGTTTVLFSRIMNYSYIDLLIK